MDNKKKVLMLLPKGCELLEAAAFTDVFGWNAVTQGGSIQTITAGYCTPLPLCFGHSFLPDMLWQDADPKDFTAAALPGGFPRWGYFAKEQEETLYPLLQKFHEQNKPIAAVCNGALHLANSGILKGGCASVYPGENGRWEKQLEQLGVKINDAPVTVWDNIITSQDPRSAVYAALRLLAKLTDEDSARRTAEDMGFEIK